MIAHSTSSRARRMTGAGLAVILVGLGLGLTASGSIAAPSQVAPTNVKPLFQAQVRQRQDAVLIADRSTRQMATGSGAADDTPTAAVAPVAPIAPIAPVAPMAAIPPIPPVPPIPSIPPVPPVPPVPSSVLSAEQVRQIHEASREAAEAARLAVANIDVAAITREAMAQARAELARECRHARPGRANETDNEAIARLAAGCVDMAEINREVRDALREATDEIRNAQDLSEADRAKALAAVERARSEAARRTNR